MKSIAQKSKYYVGNEMETILENVSKSAKDFLENLEERSHTERQNRENFYKTIIEDISHLPVEKVKYDRFNETYKVTWKWDFKPLTINVLADSIQACTSDIIIQTIKYLENETTKLKNIKDYIKEI
ncbi:hypothetical protein KQI68_06455 [Peptoniphilus sp. MSJ-1]|uniref:Uncharacterized protein n=1 Tax=Peptoniphilus ovalis TaxID=2841503 RepID=A0ABS6FJ64_9FIRM|nr:hypothetical protein [Peptoniphilus ovalis]MBU5669478.1 hypothetical protein [Peptoniphilus ovalis]